MAGAAGGDRGGDDAGATEAVGVIARREIAAHGREAVATGEPRCRRFEERRLARPGRPHEVDSGHAVLAEVGAEMPRTSVIRCEEVLMNIDRNDAGVAASAYFTHGSPSLRRDRGKCRRRAAAARP